MAGASSIASRVPGLDEVLRRLVAVFHPERIVLFGSQARGDAREDSDIDLLVVAESDEPLPARMARANRAMGELPIAVDAFVCTPAEVERYRHLLAHTVAIALREGVEVYSGA